MQVWHHGTEASPAHPTPTLRGEDAIYLPYQQQAQPRCQPSSKHAAPRCFFSNMGCPPHEDLRRSTRRLPQPARQLVVAVAVAGCISRSRCGEDSRWAAPVLGELCGQTPPQH
jgi:hypothetical protein